MQARSNSPVTGGGRYEVRVRGRLGDSFLANFESLRATVAPLETVIHGTLRDRAELHALLERIELFGIELIEVRTPADHEREPEHRTGELALAACELVPAANAPDADGTAA